MTLAADVQQLNLGTICEFFVLDTTVTGGALVLYFHPGVAYSATTTWNDVVWSAPVNVGDSSTPITYTRWPVDASGFEWNGKGTLPQPKIQVANVLGTISALNYANSDLIGAKVIRKRTLLKYLDAVNFPGSVNPTADPTVQFTNDVYYVSRKTMENPVMCEYELTSSWDVSGKQLPGRQVIQNNCPWKYRGAECGYSGASVADINDVYTPYLANDVCGKRLVSCQLRFPNTYLPFGGFPSAGLTK